MDENQHMEQRTEDEIDLKVLLLVLWKKKVSIICITFITAVLAGIVSFFFITPVYHSKLNIIINMPEIYHTKYGDYTLPITTNEQYISMITSNDLLARTIIDMNYNEDMTIESLRDRVTLDIPQAKSNVVQNSFTINVAADNPSEAKKLAQTLYDNYIEFIDVLTIEGAIDYYIDKYNVELASLEVSLNTAMETLAKNEALLLETPQTINQKEAMNELQNTPNTSEFVILENVINPNYTKIENDIIANKQLIASIENTIKVDKKYLEELNAMKLSVNNYKVNGYFNDTNDNFVSITKTNVYLPSAPIEPSSKTSPSNTRNVIIGALIGGMISIVVVLIKEYWLYSKNN